MLTSLLLSAAWVQEPVPESVSSQLDRVTVYSGQALVERTFTVAAEEPGRLQVVLGPFPAGADRSSFQIKVEEGPAVVQGMEVRQKTGKLKDSERDRIRGRIVDLQVDLRRLEADRVKIEAGDNLIQAVIARIANGGEDATDPVALETLFEFVEGRSRLLDLARVDYEASRDKLGREIKQLEQALGGRGRETRPFLEAGTALFFELPGAARLRLTYLVRGATWHPAYDVRVAPDLTGVTVGLVAELAQSTDEDWEDAEILLSTSRPSVGLDPPDLPVRTVTVPVPVPSAPGAAAPVLQENELESLGAFDDKAFKNNVGTGGGGAGGKFGGRRMRAPEVQVQDYGLTTQFLLPGRKTVKADGQSHRFTITDVPLDVRPERYVVPSRSDKAYLRAEVRLGGDTPLLPGTARVFLGPDFLGQASFPVLRPGDKTMLHLGIDPNLTVEFETVEDERDDPGFLSSTVRVTKAFRARLKLSASARGPVEILIEEVLPVSKDDRVEITAVKVQPAALAGEDDLLDRKEKGIIRWRITLPPAAEQAIHWGWQAAFDEDLHPIFREG